MRTILGLGCRLGLLFLILCAGPASAAPQEPDDPVAQLIDQRRLDAALEAIARVAPETEGYGLAMVHQAQIYSIREEYTEAMVAAWKAIAADWKADQGNAFGLLWEGRVRGAKNDAALEKVKARIYEDAKAFLAKHKKEPLAYELAYSAASLADLEKEELALRIKLLTLFPNSREAKDMGQDLWMMAAFMSKDPKDPLAIYRKRVALIDSLLPILPRGYWRNRLIEMRLSAIRQLNGLPAAAKEAEAVANAEPKNGYAAFLASSYARDIDKPALSILYAEKAVQGVAVELATSQDPKQKGQLEALTVRYLWRYASALHKAERYADAIRISEQALEAVKKVRRPVTEAEANLFQFGLQTPPNLVMGLCYEKLGQPDKAMKHYARVAALSDGGNNQAPEAEAALRKLYTKKHGSTDGMLADFAKQAGVVAPQFEDVTQAYGLGDTQGSRGSFGDFDGDGFVDMAIAGKLFRNIEGKRYENVTKKAKFSGDALWLDLDNDGDLDAVSTGYGIQFNDGKGGFTSAKLKKPKGAPSAATAAVGALDYDGDGRLDLYFANMPPDIHGGHGLTPKRTPDHLYRNIDGKTFVESAAKAGLNANQTHWCGRGINCGDYDNDGDTDIFVSNYSLHPNALWQNDGKGTFRNVAYELNLDGEETEGYWGHTIGSVWGDLDNDGDLDLVTANLAHPRVIHISDPTKVYMNQGGPNWTFKDFTEASGLRYDETHSDVSLVDADNDGDLDLYLTQIYGGRRTNLCLNDGTGRFTEVTWYAGVRHFDVWQHAWADIDNDGDLDLLVCSGSAGVRLYRNQGNGHHWLRVKPVGHHCNRDAAGARVTVTSGDLRQIRDIVIGRGTGSQDEIIAHFGLGPRGGAVTVTVRFPCGKTVTQKGVKPDQKLTVDEPAK